MGDWTIVLHGARQGGYWESSRHDGAVVAEGLAQVCQRDAP